MKTTAADFFVWSFQALAEADKWRAEICGSDRKRELMQRVVGSCERHADCMFRAFADQARHNSRQRARKVAKAKALSSNPSRHERADHSPAATVAGAF